MVTRSDQLFAIGSIQPNGTVKGGTGWGVELARLFNRPVHVFDQEKSSWFRWSGSEWESTEPSLPAGTMAVTGTRNLTDASRDAIRSLFERSLGAHDTAAK